MLPVIAIVGRPNVGKSTLFNALTRTRDAIVADQAGLTRDRKYGLGKLSGRRYMVVDTGGLNNSDDSLDARISQQALKAVEEADVVLFLVDGRAGLTALDETIARQLRTYNKSLYLVINKAEGFDPTMISVDFHRLGFQNYAAISASHGQGVMDLILDVLAPFPIDPEPAEDTQQIRVAVVGRPNVGKSTLINRILGEERLLTFDAPGTTRDSISVPFERDGQAFLLIDTAGIRRKSKIDESIEKFSVIKSLQALELAHVVVMMFDAREGITEQDASLLGLVVESGRSLVLAINKWDGLSEDQRNHVKATLERKFHFIDFAKPQFISALHGSGVGTLFQLIRRAYTSAFCKVSTPQLNRLLEELVSAHPPPLVKGRRIKLRYMHQGGQNPPLFIIHGNQTDDMPEMYQRYLNNALRNTLKLEGTPIKINFKQSENPFKDRKNTLTPHQIKKRRRLVRFAKK
jgi:GTPase